MDVENQGEDASLSTTIVTSAKSMCLDSEEQSVAASQLMEMYANGDENAPKARKPYTITKQRERWTDDEHKKFLEALKLYGRAWRRIEEHVGTKTAVQIRSHAQKFFSKVVRETNDEVSPVKAIEIPPPRPKRKPTHPYPRKQVQTVNKRVSVSVEVERSLSPTSLISEQENQSPKSVLSASGSDTLGSSVSNLPNDAQSLVSSDGIRNSPGMEDNKYQSSTSATEEDNGSPSTFATSSFTAQEQSSMKLDVGSEDDASKGSEDDGSKAESMDIETEIPTMSLKLFGTTVLVTDSHRPSSLAVSMSKPLAAESHHEHCDVYKGETVQLLPEKLMEKAHLMEPDINNWNAWPHGNLSMIYPMQLTSETSIPVEAASVMSMPWWWSQGGLPFPSVPSFKLNPVPAPPQDAFRRETSRDSDAQEKEGSSTGSSTSELRMSKRSSDVADSNNQEPSSNKKPRQDFVLKPSMGSAFSPIRANPNKCIKGFVPYKRCVAEKEDQISTIVREERDGQRFRLCL